MRFLYNFRKIHKKESIFVRTQTQYDSTYRDFRKYAEYLTIQQGKAIEKSGKARSYADWIIRIVIFCNEKADKPLSNLLDIHTLSQFEEMMQMPQFKQFNQKENRFPQASIKQFLKYAAYKAQAQTEDMQDYVLNALSDEVHETIATYTTKQSTDTSRLRKEKIEGKFGYGYPRSLAESSAAKAKSQWHCEYDYNHQTFIGKDGHPYVEAHHLIPMAQQDFFELNIDIAPNIVALCPTCHRNIHFGQPEAKKQMLQKLFNDRLATYETLEIPITFQQLLAFYYIFE